jgi:transglutaminase-like putative cysteine protease
MISALEDETIAKSYVASAALNKDDVLVNWSLIKTPLPLTDPRRAEFLRFEVLQQPTARTPLSDERQRCEPESRRVVCEIDATRSIAFGKDPVVAALQPSSTVQSNDAMIRTLARRITAGRVTVPEQIDAVLAWIEQNIRKEPVDSFSALDVLDAKRGECQGHAYLYAALMRALGVPTRVVNGLVYSSDYGGFLYHTWAESLVDGGWRAVDPTFAQPRADATHIALVRGENLLDLVPIVDWVGNTRIRVLEAR